MCGVFAIIPRDIARTPDEERLLASASGCWSIAGPDAEAIHSSPASASPTRG